MDALRELYQQLIVEHHRHPRNFGRLDPADAEAEGRNPLCGDHLHLYLRWGEDGRIEDVRFEGEGCAISVASASLMTEALRGKTKEEFEELFEKVHAMLTGEAEPDPALGKLVALAGVRAFPVRVKCATLAWHTAKKAVEEGGGTATTEQA